MPATIKAPDSRMENLKRANDVRTKRARLKIDLKEQRVTVRYLVLEPPDYLLSMKVRDLLIAAPGIGRVKADQHLRRCGIGSTKTVGEEPPVGISTRQRVALLKELGK